MQDKRILILNNQQAEAKIARIAAEILEQTYPEKELILVGIDSKGEIIARKLATLIENNMGRKIHILKAIPVRKNDSTISLQIPELPSVNAAGKTVLIVDDVLYSGKTIYYTLEKIMQANPSKVQAVVLIDRGHRSFPVHADYTGLELGTTLQEHIQVEIDSNREVKAYLFS